MNKQQYVAALRELADFVEQRDFPEQSKLSYGYGKSDNFSAPELSFWTYDKTDFANICAAMGSFEKKRDQWCTGAVNTLPGGATVRVTASRETICRKVVVGTRKVEAKPEEIIPAEPEHEEDIVEWECPESFIALKEEQ